jgi:hypothetical protein
MIITLKKFTSTLFKIFKVVFVHKKSCCKAILFLCFIQLVSDNLFAQKIVHYDLYVKDTIGKFYRKTKKSYRRERANTDANPDFYGGRYRRNLCPQRT